MNRNSGSPEFSLDWPGKRESKLLSQSGIENKSLIPDFDVSKNWDSTGNIVIEGDNLDALKLLQKSYYGKFKMIYIDPPYNTGNKFEYEYDDSFIETKTSGEQNFSDGLTINQSTAAVNHSGWLNMIYPRIVLARNLLKDDGAIFVSINDKEVHHLKILLEEIFGEQNFVSQIVWAAGKKNDSRFVSASHDYVLVFAKNIVSLSSSVGKWRLQKEGLDEIYKAYNRFRKKFGDDHVSVESELKKWFSALPENNPSKRHKVYYRVDSKGIFRLNVSVWPGRGGPTYEVLHPITGRAVKTPSRGWRWTQETMNKKVLNDEIFFGVNENYVPMAKIYLKDHQTEVPYSVTYVNGRGASGRLQKLLGGDFFRYPKDEIMLQKFVEMAANDPGDLCLDFFGGSGSFGHAVMAANAKDSGTRKYFLVQLPVEVPYDEFDTIADILRERLRRAGDNLLDKTGSTSLDMGFRSYRIVENVGGECSITEQLHSGKELI